MDSRYNNEDGCEIPEQVVEYEEVVLDDQQQQYVEVEIEDDQTQYYEEYVDVDEGASVDPNTVYYEQVIEEKPILRSTNSTLSNIGNAGGPSNYYNQNQRFIQPFAVPSLPVRPLNQGSIPYSSKQIVGGYPRPKPSIATSLVYTPSTLLGNRRDSANHPFSSNFLHIFPTSSKPPKIRKVSSKKKPCNCNKSMCLKLYCDCFANGEFCLDCNCKDCHNNLEHEAERSRAIKASLERNPSAFKPKIGVAAKAAGKAVDMERLHQRGCNCKRSNCLKNYCECYEAKVPCTDRCKCQSCRNTEQDRHNKFKDKFSTTAGGLAQLAAAAADTRGRGRSRSVDSDLDGSDVIVETEEQQRERAQQQNPKAQPWFYMTDDVIEATTMCLVSQAQEYEQTMSEEDLERSVLKEFGRCLEQIIESANSCLPSSQIHPQPQISTDIPSSSSNVQ